MGEQKCIWSNIFMDIVTRSRSSVCRMCYYYLLPYMCRMCWHVCACSSMCQHSNAKATHSNSKHTISSNITCTPETSICLAHLVPSLTRSSSPFPSVSSLIPHLAPSSTPAPFFHLCLFHFHLFISHLRPRLSLCLCGFLYCICRISSLSSPSPSFFSSSLCRMFV